MYECVAVKPYRGKDEILNEEGDLDGESDVSDIDMNEFGLRRNSGSLQSVTSTSSTRGEAGSPMDESE
jgi:hypothetical protein